MCCVRGTGNAWDEGIYSGSSLPAVGKMGFKIVMEEVTEKVTKLRELQEFWFT